MVVCRCEVSIMFKCKVHLFLPAQFQRQNARHMLYVHLDPRCIFLSSQVWSQCSYKVIFPCAVPVHFFVKAKTQAHSHTNQKTLFPIIIRLKRHNNIKTMQFAVCCIVVVVDVVIYVPLRVGARDKCAQGTLNTAPAVLYQHFPTYRSIISLPPI